MDQSDESGRSLKRAKYLVSIVTVHFQAYGLSITLRPILCHLPRDRLSPQQHAADQRFAYNLDSA